MNGQPRGQGEWGIVAATVWEPQRAWAVSLDPQRVPMAPMLLEGSAFNIWQVAHRVSTTPELIYELAAELGVESGVIEGDVRTFVEQLIDQGLLSRGDQRAQGR